MSKHTPGPWRVFSQGLRGGMYWSVYRPNREEPIDLPDDDNGEADASLIARAPEMADTIAALTARVVELEAALRPLACTCEAESQDECSRSEKHCPFWTARAAITKGEGHD